MSSQPPTIATISVPADPAYLSVCRQALVGAVDQLALADEQLDDLKLVLSETCANAIVHGSRSPADVIDVEFRASESEVEVTVIDHGPGFSGGRLPEQQGVGLSLLARLCSRHRIDPARPGGGAAVMFALSFDG
jgi:anti-sigma regulatory factor (Ser/Thr protein kinase)